MGSSSSAPSIEKLSAWPLIPASSPSKVLCMAIAPAQSLVAICLDPAGIQFFHYPTGKSRGSKLKLVATVDRPVHAVSLTFSTDGTQLLACFGTESQFTISAHHATMLRGGKVASIWHEPRNVATIFSIALQRAIVTLRHCEALHCGVWSPDGSVLVTGHLISLVFWTKRWEETSSSSSAPSRWTIEREVKLMSGAAHDEEQRISVSSNVKSVQYTADGSQVISLCSTGVYVVNPESGTVKSHIETAPGCPGYCVSPGDCLICISSSWRTESSGRVLRFFDIQGNENCDALVEMKSQIPFAFFCSNPNFLICVSYRGQLSILDISTTTSGNEKMPPRIIGSGGGKDPDLDCLQTVMSPCRNLLLSLEKKASGETSLVIFALTGFF